MAAKYKPQNKSCPNCDLDTVYDPTAWGTSKYRIHTETRMMLCSDGKSTPHTGSKMRKR